MWGEKVRYGCARTCSRQLVCICDFFLRYLMYFRETACLSTPLRTLRETGSKKVMCRASSISLVFCVDNFLGSFGFKKSWTLWNISEWVSNLCVHHKLPSVLTSTLNIGEWSDSLSSYQLKEESFPGSHWRGGCLGTRVARNRNTISLYSKYNYNCIDAVF
jgi:hypothetical protein